MKVLRKFMFAAITALPVILCSCPDSCVDENDPRGFVVKMKNDYSDKVLVRMTINDDTSYCCASVNGHTTNILDDYYDLHCHSYNIAAYTSIEANKWDDSILDSVSQYVIDTDPYEEIYAYYKKNYSIDELKKIIENNEFNKFERLK